MTIKDIPKEERPRERLISLGVEQLNNEELLSILLKTGNKNSSVKELSNSLLKEVGSIGKLGEVNYHFLRKIKGIGDAKACSILTAIELGKRIKNEQNNLRNIQITNAEAVFSYFNNLFYGVKQEYFYCVYLDNRKKVLEVKLLFIGTVNQSLVHPREVFKEALLLSASSIICVHNHPSGYIFPSRDDKELTNRLIEIGKLIGIRVIDHIIIGSDEYYSFLENGLMSI
ncbi:MAG: JAB domain-containing protein [Firmicutes bacterium]|nr:JAB domain-containing protein [Bacillota bacterium]